MEKKSRLECVCLTEWRYDQEGDIRLSISVTPLVSFLSHFIYQNEKSYCVLMTCLLKLQNDIHTPLRPEGNFKKLRSVVLYVKTPVIAPTYESEIRHSFFYADLYQY